MHEIAKNLGSFLSEMKVVVFLYAFIVSSAQAGLIPLGNTTVALTNLGLHLIGPNGNFERFSLTNLSLFATHQFFNPQQPTVLFSYGYTDNFTSPVTDLIVKAYNSRGGYNFAVIDWKDYDTGNYISVISRMHWIASQFGEKLYDIHKDGKINLNTWHFLGFSLGAHLVGFTARKIQESSNRNVVIPRITALDAAGPGFYEPIIVYVVMKPLQKSDAKFVDVIHTDSKIAGTKWKIGHVDFWPNEGLAQPGCSLLTPVSMINPACSHQRAYYFYAESVANKNEKTFHAVKCRSFLSWKMCSNFIGAYMGFDAMPTIPEGDYYLKTNAESPYSKGLSGTENL